MKFLDPAMLWGLLAVGIPIIIHLFNFRRTKKIYFSNVSLLKTVDIQTSSFRRLKNWLILACRIGLIACLVIAFAQPFLPTEQTHFYHPSAGTSIYIDNSYSMQNESSQQRVLDLAINKLNEGLGRLKNKGNIQLLTNDFSSEDVQFSTADQIRDRLTTLSLTPTTRSIEQIYHRQQKILSDRAAQGNLYFMLSDFQKSTVGDLTKINPDSNNRVYLVPTQFPAKRNMYVDSVWLDNPFVRELHNNVLYAKIRNSGEEAITQQAVRLYIQDMQVSSASVNIPPHEAATVSFNFSLKSKGVQVGKIIFEDFPITFDNEYYFTLKTTSAITIHHLYGEQPKEGSIRQVFSNDSLFRLTQHSVQNIDYGLLKEADLIVLEGVQRPSSVLIESLSSLLAQGTTVLVIPSKESDVATYQNWLGQWGIQVVKTTDNPFVALTTPDTRIPFFADVYEQTVKTDQSLVDMPQIKRIWTWNNSGNTLLESRDGKPYLTSVPYQKGKLMLMATSLASEYSTFSQHALFVPVMYKIASSSVSVPTLAYDFSNRFITLPLPQGITFQNKIVKLKSGDTELVPSYRIIGNQLLLEIPSKEQLSLGNQLKAGPYEVWVGETKVDQVAINFSKEESDLTVYSAEELREIVKNNPSIEVLDGIEDVRLNALLEDQYVGKSLWKYFLLAALFFLLLEIGLLRWMK